MIAGLTPSVANAYTAAGDRNFPATLVLPQIAPIDGFWVTPQALPMTSGTPPMNGTQTQLTGTYSKTITERLGIQFEDGFTNFRSTNKAQNFDVVLNYEAILNQPHEFVLSFQLDHNFGSHEKNLPPSPATTLAITFGKGFGDLPIGYLRPLAITGYAGYSVAEGRRPNAVTTGFSVQYSIPYLLSKVADIDLPPFLRGMTPLTEFRYISAVGRNYGQKPQVLVAPGISYTQGRGWEAGIEALVPATKAAGRGVGVIAQLVIQLDYLLPNSIVGQPIFPLNELR
ncbi:MAG: hypothetical protein JOZ17_01495 [Acetobacteraceae bacterium]|nr:hypothetical protein [Acetobacteraceae bacterium]